MLVRRFLLYSQYYVQIKVTWLRIFLRILTLNKYYAISLGGNCKILTKKVKVVFTIKFSSPFQRFQRSFLTLIVRFGRNNFFAQYRSKLQAREILNSLIIRTLYKILEVKIKFEELPICTIPGTVFSCRKPLIS